MKEQDDSFVVDFVGGAVGHRFRSGEGRGQALPKAAGFTKGRTPKSSMPRLASGETPSCSHRSGLTSPSSSARRKCTHTSLTAFVVHWKRAALMPTRRRA